MSEESHNGGLPGSFASALSGMLPGREALFLSILSHNVTVSVRGVYADKLGADESLRRLYGLNEIQHQISGRLMHLAAVDDLRPADLFVGILLEDARNYGCEGELLVAFKFTLPFA